MLMPLVDCCLRCFALGDLLRLRDLVLWVYVGMSLT